MSRKITHVAAIMLLVIVIWSFVLMVTNLS